MTNTSREYAEALYALAEESGGSEVYLSGAETAEAALAEEPGFLDLLASPAIPREERMKALEAALGKELPLPMMTLLRLMIARGHARDLPRMLAAFRDLAQERRGESVCRVWSAVALTDGEQDALRAKLEKRFGRKMILECQVDPSLLGGVRIETEGRVLDGTLRTRLQEMKEVMEA